MRGVRGSSGGQHGYSLRIIVGGRKHFALRIDPALWEELEAWAQDELRSVNGQIEYILREAVKKRRRLAAVDGERRGVPGKD